MVEQRSEDNVSNTSSAINDVGKADRPARRSSRLDEAVTITVMGIDSWRGPYREQVSTLSISAHGCKYESKYQVMGDSLVILELPSSNPKDPPLSTRARMKWVKRPDGVGELFQTAIELEEPGNIWGLPNPPEDWPNFSIVRKAADLAAKPHLVAIPSKNDASDSDTFANLSSRSSSDSAARTGASASKASNAALQMPKLPGASPSVAQLMQEIQGHMERMVGNAVQAVVRERAAEAMKDIREQLHRDAERLISELIAARAATMPAASALASGDAAPVANAEWQGQIETAVKQATDQIESRSRELDEKASTLVASATDHVQRLMESKRIEEVDRFVGRLKEQLTPLLDRAQQISTELHKTKEQIELFLADSQAATGNLQKTRNEIEALVDDSQKSLVDLGRAKYEIERVLDDSQKTVEQMALNSTTRIEEKSRELEEKFVEVIDARLFWASGEIEREGRALMDGELDRLHETVATYPFEAEAETKLKSTTENIISQTIETLRETVNQKVRGDLEIRLQTVSDSIVSRTSEVLDSKAAETQKHFEQQIADTGNQHLDKVGSALSDLASVLKRFSKE